MVNSMVERATSDKLIGPDWAMNIEICETLNHDAGQMKDVVKGIKRRMRSRNPKVQLLALTLLETLVKNCGEIIHMHVAERDILHDMVRIVKKKHPDVRVREKILVLIDVWQEAFGGPRSRHTHYYAAYQELLRSGVRFPQRSTTNPVFIPQTPLASDPSNMHNSSNEETAELSAEDEYPTLSLTEIENARSIMGVLSDMLNALDPKNKEELKQDVIVDLVAQCRTYKQRVVHLVNSTSDESLLRQGLALNDELQRLLAKHEAIASGTPLDELNLVPAGPLVDVDTPLIDTGENGQPNVSASSAVEGASLDQLLLPAPPMSNGASSLGTADQNIDLLSGDGFGSQIAETSLALVPTDESHLSNSIPMSQQNALVPFDMLSDYNSASVSASAQNIDKAGQHNPSTSQSELQYNIQSSEAELYRNGITPNGGSAEHEQTMFSDSGWNGHNIQQQQFSDAPVHGTESDGAFPPPPWEVQQSDDSPIGSEQHPQPMHFMQPVQNGVQQQGPQSMMDRQMVGMYMQPNTVGQQPAANNFNQFVGFHPQQMQGMQYVGMPQQYQFGQMGPMYPQPIYGGQMGAYGYAQQQGFQNLNQQMSGLTMRDDIGFKSSSNSSYTPPTRPPKPEDKLFGDLVDIARFKSPRPSPAKADSM